MFASLLFKCPCKTKPALNVANSRRRPRTHPAAADPAQLAVRKKKSQRDANIFLV